MANALLNVGHPAQALVPPVPSQRPSPGQVPAGAEVRGTLGVGEAFAVDEEGPVFAAVGEEVDDDFTLAPGAVVELLRELGTKGDGPTVLIGLEVVVVDVGGGGGGVRPRVVGRGMCFDF